MTPLLEVCCASARSVQEAATGRAHRIELCEALHLDGLTPRDTLISMAVATGIPVQVLIRPRAGSFVYTPREVEAMAADICRARSLGARGVVIGALTPDGDIDRAAVTRLMAECRGLSVTFHRAFDVCRHPLRALEEIISLGCHRLLTSGQAPDAESGIPMLRSLVTQAADRISIMPGAGVTPHNAVHILTATGASEIHGSLRTGDHTDARLVREVVSLLQHI